ncbi:MAG TPA: thiolase family protein [Stellaceae bacterium]|nr:thiolase family protein [Stellaceae bacterium]
MALRDAAIVGFAETKIVEKSDRDIWELGAEILDGLLTSTGFEKQEIDGLVLSASMTGSGNPFWSQTTADQLGLELDFCQTVDIGGSSPLGALARAAAAIDAGLCTTAMLLYADTQGAENNSRMRSFNAEWTMPYGLLGPPGAFGLLSKRYEHLYGLDYSMLGKLAVAQRGHAVLNPNAVEKLRQPITVDDYINSRMIAEPIRLLDSVMVCDGASGLLVTSRTRARRKRIAKYVTPVGYGERTNFRIGESVVDVTQSGHLAAGKKAFAEAGLTASAICSFHPYDDFVIAMMIQMEMLGFCKPGQGCAFIREHDFTHTGDLPLNTGGGQISAGQPGLAGGGVNLVEAVRQLMGAGGARQVKRINNALVTGIGGIPYGRNWATSTAMILTPGA